MDPQTMQTIFVLIGVLIGGSFLRGLEHWWDLRKLEQEKEADAAALAKRVILPIGATHDDYLWAKNALVKAGDATTPVENLCSCGYMSECAMHCNHELMPDKCTGPRWEPWDPIIKQQIEVSQKRLKEEQAKREAAQKSRHMILPPPKAKKKAPPPPPRGRGSASVSSSIQSIAKIKQENARLGQKLREQEKALADMKKSLATPDKVRKRADERSLTTRELRENLEKAILESYRVPPQILGPEPTYLPVLDAYHYPCCNRKITRQTLQDQFNYVHDCPVVREKENIPWSGKFVAVDNCDDCYEVQDFSGWVQTLHSNNCSKASNMLQ